MLKDRITSEIRKVLMQDHGFEIYVKMKDVVGLKKMAIKEDPVSGKSGNFKNKISKMIENTIQVTFLSEEAEYVTAESISENKKAFYVIRQGEDYHPFAELNDVGEDAELFSMDECSNAEGILFRFETGEQDILWAYQQIWPVAISKKERKSVILKLSPEQNDIFVEMDDELFTITQKVDLLIVSSTGDTDGEVIQEIVTANIKLMESHFDFETFVNISVACVIERIAETNLVSGTEKLEDYVSRGNKKYARKMMNIKDSPVLKMDEKSLYERVNHLPRWQGKFKFDDDNHIVLNTFKNVEDLIDLFNERYTRSDVTGEEYDTSAKIPVSNIS